MQWGCVGMCMQRNVRMHVGVGVAGWSAVYFQSWIKTKLQQDIE
jgi:hypothetical protein